MEQLKRLDENKSMWAEYDDKYDVQLEAWETFGEGRGNTFDMEIIVQTDGRSALGEFAHFNDDVLFGENWNNHDIDVKTRSIITVVVLMSLGITDSSLKYHLQNAKNHGVTQCNYYTRSFLCGMVKGMGSI